MSGIPIYQGAIRPHAIIKVNGQLVADGFNQRLISVSVEDKRGVESDTVRVELRDGNPFIEIPQKGDLMEVWLGYLETGTAYFGKFTIDDPEVKMFPFTMSIGGKGADMHDKLKQQKARHWDNKTVKEIITEIATDNNLEPVIDDTVAGKKYQWIGQQDESDIHFAERLAKRHGAIFSVKDGKLIFAKKGSEKSAKGKDLSPILASPDNIVGSATVTFSHRSKFKNVKAHKQNKQTAERDLFSEESDVDGTADYEMSESYADDEEAKAAAKSKADDLKAKTVTTSVTLVGDPTVRAGAPFTYKDCRPEVDDLPFNIETASHNISKSGYTVAVDADINPDKDNQQKKAKSKKNKGSKGNPKATDLDWSDVEKK